MKVGNPKPGVAARKEEPGGGFMCGGVVLASCWVWVAGWVLNF